MMPALTPAQQRTLRRRHQHERQAVVFGSLIAGIALAGLGATAVYTGTMDVPFLQREFSTPPPEVSEALRPPPCPGEDMLPVTYDSIEVRVYNGTSRVGLAGATATALEARGFVVLEVDDYLLSVDESAWITFGEAGIAAAYTVAAQMENPVLLMDTRTDASVDLVLGEAFDVLLDPGMVPLDATSPLLPIGDCVPLEEARARAVPGPTRSPTPPADEGEEAEPGTAGTTEE